METGEIQVKVLGPTEVTVDETKGIKVMEGIPTKVDVKGEHNPPGTEVIDIPNLPHVFQVDQLRVWDKSHNPGATIDDIKVLIAHGEREDNKWVFRNGQSVAETVEAYNKYAQSQNTAPVEFLVVCNKQPEDGSGIRIGEFDANHNIAYAVGDRVMVTMSGGFSRVGQDGKVYLSVSNERQDRDFFGVDELIKHREVASKIKILP